MKKPELKCGKENCDGFIMVKYLDPVSMDDKQYFIVCGAENCTGKLPFFLDDLNPHDNMGDRKRRT